MLIKLAFHPLYTHFMGHLIYKRNIHRDSTSQHVRSFPLHEPDESRMNRKGEGEPPAQVSPTAESAPAKIVFLVPIG
jgi:hypothetical protein